MSQDWFAAPPWLESPRHILAATVAVINPLSEVLLVESPRRGWELPGGRVELAESIQEAAIREVREESGIVVELVRFCGVFQNVPKSITSLLFTAKPVGGELTTSAESVAVGWFTPDAALARVARSTMQKRIELALATDTVPFVLEHQGEIAG